jgi:serine/threonine-protein kinase
MGSQLPSTTRSQVSLKKLGRYELVRVLGKGAMGIVYEGRDPNLDRRVAIKTVKVENLSEEAAAEYEHRFRTEARSAARLQHPNIVSVYDSDRDGDIAFLVMEFIQGDDLKHHLDKGVRYSLEQSLKMVRDLLSALDYAHKQGIVHRDIKPANLLIEPGGRVKLTDFGVARIQDSGEATRTQGSMVGTLKYMAPEQVQGQKIDSRADLFSVGVVVYQLLTDKRPFDGDNDFSIIHQIIGHNPPPPSSINARLPGAIDAVVARALAKNRDERFATARDFASALQSAIRRAEDVTVVPAANPLKQVDTTGTGSRGQSVGPGGVTSPSTTVTQEVELVYWKDIKDSADREEFEAFLEKFPDGIYADLARRRLRKLTSASTSADQTVLSGMPGADAQPDLDATRVRTGTQPSVISAVASPTIAPPTIAPAPAAEAADDAGDAGDAQPPSDPPPSEFPSTITLAPGRGTDETRSGTVASVAVAVSSPAPAPAPAPVPTPVPTAQTAPTAPNAQRKKPPVAAIAGIAAVVLAGVVAFALMGRDSSSTADAQAAMPAASAASATTAAAPQLAASTPAPAVAASEARHPAPAAVAQAPKHVPSKVAKPKIVASALTPEPARPASVAPPPVREPSKPASAAPVPAAANAVEACRDRVFFARELCLADVCDKPGARNHPLCVKWREDKRLRENSRVKEGG